MNGNVVRIWDIDKLTCVTYVFVLKNLSFKINIKSINCLHYFIKITRIVSLVFFLLLKKYFCHQIVFFLKKTKINNIINFQTSKESTTSQASDTVCFETKQRKCTCEKYQPKIIDINFLIFIQSSTCWSANKKKKWVWEFHSW